MTTLSDILDSLSLSSHLSTFEEEELTLETLTWMSKDDPKEFLSSMEELGLSASDATKLLSKLSPPAEANFESGQMWSTVARQQVKFLCVKK